MWKCKKKILVYLWRNKYKFFTNTFSFFLGIFNKHVCDKCYIMTHFCRHGFVEIFHYFLTAIAGLLCPHWQIFQELWWQKAIKDTDTHSSMCLYMSKPVRHVLPTQIGSIGVCCMAVWLKPQPICTNAPRTHAMCVTTSLRVRAPLFELQKPAVICQCLKRAVKVVNAHP